MARLKQTPDESEPYLKVPLSEVVGQIDGRIEAGALLRPSHAQINSVTELKERRDQMYSWDEYNRTLLKKLFGGDILSEYRQPVSFGGASDPNLQIQELEEDIGWYSRQLDSIKSRAPLWEVDGENLLTSTSTQSAPDASGPIFIVHGRDSGRKNEVARVLERITEREVVILHEQANRGRTLLEKFEQHAQSASFAVVLLTADDVGGVKDAKALSPRGRQNVIFELGFMFAALGRDRVIVLLDSGVEQPSDVKGLVYEDFDAAGAWKQQLARELEAAGIPVDRNKMP